MPLCNGIVSSKDDSNKGDIYHDRYGKREL